MSYRNPIFANGEIYHIFNKSVGNEQVFINPRDNNRMLSLFSYYRFSSQLRYSHFIRLTDELKLSFWEHLSKSPPLVEMYAFSLMPNHFHLLVKQFNNEGITKFISNIQNSYAKFFNTKFERKGSLFCEKFKAVRIESNEQLIHVSRYVHINPVTSYIIEISDLDTYPNTSFSHYMNKIRYDFINKQFILDGFKSEESYRSFVQNNVDYQRKLSEIKHLRLD